MLKVNVEKIDKKNGRHLAIARRFPFSPTALMSVSGIGADRDIIAQVKGLSKGLVQFGISPGVCVIEPPPHNNFTSAMSIFFEHEEDAIVVKMFLHE